MNEDGDERENVVEHLQIPSKKFDLTLYPTFNGKW